jgi:hypothetical protein
VVADRAEDDMPITRLPAWRGIAGLIVVYLLLRRNPAEMLAFSPAAGPDGASSVVLILGP